MGWTCWTPGRRKRHVSRARVDHVVPGASAASQAHLDFDFESLSSSYLKTLLRHPSCFATAPCALLSFHRRDSPEMAEAIQQLVLDTLDKEGTIKDTRTLVLPGYKEPAATHDSQIIILGALNSLSSRDVKIIPCTAVYSSINRCLSDDLLYHPRNSFSCPYSRGCSDSSSRFS